MLRHPLVVILILSLSGCAASSGTHAATSSSVAAPATADDESGGLEGIVTDDETMPIANVEVAILGTALATKTDAGGRFSFSDLEPGSVHAAFQRIGYEAVSKKAEIKTGEITNMTIVLAPIAIVEVYPEVLPYKGYIKLGTALTAAAESDTGVTLGCGKCMNRFNASKDVVNIVFEAMFQSTLPDPREMKLYTQTRADGQLLLNRDWANREKILLEKGWSKGQFAQFLACGNVSFSICYEQPFEIFTTLFHNGAAPEDYTALPPP